MDTTFDRRYFEKRRHIAWRGPTVARAVRDVVGPRIGRDFSVVDVGGGIGDIAKGLLDLGMDAWVIDGPWADEFRDLFELPAERYLFFDLAARPHRLRGDFDLALCFETFSVIPEDVHDHVKDNIAALAPRILAGRVDGFPGYRELPEVGEEFRAYLAPWKDLQAVKAIYNSARYFEAE